MCVFKMASRWLNLQNMEDLNLYKMATRVKSTQNKWICLKWKTVYQDKEWTISKKFGDFNFVHINEDSLYIPILCRFFLVWLYVICPLLWCTVSRLLSESTRFFPLCYTWYIPYQHSLALDGRNLHLYLASFPLDWWQRMSSQRTISYRPCVGRCFIQPIGLRLCLYQRHPKIHAWKEFLRSRHNERDVEDSTSKTKPVLLPGLAASGWVGFG